MIKTEQREIKLLNIVVKQYWYARLGWTYIGHDELFGHRAAVMSIPI